MINRITPRIQKFLQVFFQHLYTRLAFLYDAVAALSSMGQWKLWVRTAKIDFGPGLILELGHGPGHLLHDLKEAHYPVVGLDPSRSMNRIARNRLQSAGYTAEMVRGMAQALPFAGETFSAIVSTFPSEYIFEPDTIKEAHRTLISGGTLVVIGIIEITGTSIQDRCARWLYEITGQSGAAPDGWGDFLREYGFSPRLEQVILTRSRVTRLVATRH